MKKKRRSSITAKINIIIVITLIVGIGAISFFFFRTITGTIEDSIFQNFEQQADILQAAIENFMLPGRAELAVGFFDDLKNTTFRDLLGEYSVRLIRTNGVLAFSDLATINDVVGRVPELEEVFADPVERLVDDMSVMNAELNSALGPPPRAIRFELADGDQHYIGSYVPLLNLPQCTKCHGADHTVRGVVDIRHNITRQRRRQFDAGVLSGALFVSIVLLLTVVLSLFLRRTIVRPVKTIGVVCADVTNGDFSRRVPVRSRDEIGRLGETVNTMVEGLHERFELQKYVSSTTLESLLGDKTGSTCSLTMLFSDIRGFTSYTEKRSAAEVVSHLNAVLNAQSEIIQAKNGDIDKYVGDEIVAMFSEETQAIDAISAALAIQQELTRNDDPAYDGLQVGIGINTGEVILGMIGSERRADYTVIGDNVNTASRLCDAAEPGGILIAESTYRAAADRIETDGPYRLKAKGKGEYVKVYRVIGLKERRR